MLDKGIRPLEFDRPYFAEFAGALPLEDLRYLLTKGFEPNAFPGCLRSAMASRKKSLTRSPCCWTMAPT